MLTKAIKAIADCPLLPIYYLAGLFNSSSQTQSITFDELGASGIEEVFNRHNTDKAKLHDYHLGYEYFLAEQLTSSDEFSMLEIGIGSSDDSLPFNMGKSASIGASLYCWRELFKSAVICGADIDPKCMIKDHRISTYPCNQLSVSSLVVLKNLLQSSQFPPFRIIIDDGYHSFGANRRTYLTLSSLIKPGSVYIIEDVSPWVQLAWKGFALLHRVNLRVANFPASKQPLLMIAIYK